MSIVRDIGYTLEALEERALITCSTGAQVFSGTGVTIASSDGAVGISGRIIDRLGDQLTTIYTVAWPAAFITTTRGTTEADAKLTLGIKLQHGNSSAGGDMADYSTGSQPTDRTFFTTARTTPEYEFSTGVFRGQSDQCYYDIRAANRYIRAVVFATKNKSTTESSGFEAARVKAVITFASADTEKQNAWTSVGSTSTSTST